MNRAMILDLLNQHRDEFLKRFGARHLALFGSAARDELRANGVIRPSRIIPCMPTLP